MESNAVMESPLALYRAATGLTQAAIAAKLGLTYAEAEAEVARRMLAEMTA